MARIKKFRIKNSTSFSWKNVSAAVLVFGLIGGGLFIYRSFAAGCTLSSPVTTTVERKIKLNLTGCTGTQYFTVSESEDFGAGSGVKVQIINVAEDKSYADLSITYPNGTPATSSMPFSVPTEQKQINMLAVLYTFEDANGQIAGLGDYQTPTWLQRLAFGDGVVGFDGYFKNYSLRDYLYQSTNGRINLTGQVYPTIIKLPLEKYRQFLSGGESGNFDEGVLKAIEKSNPGYLASNKFDFLLALSSEQYSVYRNLYPTTSNVVGAGEFGKMKALMYAIPFDRSKSILDEPIQENRTSFDANRVITRYNPETVEGVWLASDTNRTGTNFYTGGSIITSVNTTHRHIQLGTPLSSANTEVTVRYKAQTPSSYDQTSPNQAIADNWYPHFTHELLHVISAVPGFSFSQRNHIGDLYHLPSNVGDYDIMHEGGELGNHPFYNENYHEPSLLSGYNKLMLGYIRPHTLKFGENETSVRIYRSESGGSMDSSKTTLIKIPLRPTGDIGLAARKSGTNAGYNKQFRGSEYLMLEWKYKGDGLENEMHNFDRLVPSEGLIVYRMIEADTYSPTGHGMDVTRVMDATPPNSAFTEGFSDVAGSSALFGPQSGVMSYTTDSFWQEKLPATDALTFEHLLSPGQGTKTLYVKFADANGTVIGNQTLTIDLTADQPPASRMPSMSFTNLPSGTQIGTSLNVAAAYTAPNGAKTIHFYVDGVLKLDRSENSISQTQETFFIRARDYKPGTHELKAVFYDGAMNKVETTSNFVITSTTGDSTQPVVAITSPSSGAIVSGIVDVPVAATDNSAMAKVEFYINGTLRLTDITPPYSYVWDTTYQADGNKTVKAVAYDVAGNFSSTQAGVNVQNGTTPPPTDITPPTLDIVSPVSGATVTGTVNFAATATDNIGVAKVDFLVNGSVVSTDTSDPYSHSWNSAALANGSYTLDAKAYDAANNISSDQISVTVQNGDTEPPTTPTGVSATAATYNRVDLSWTASTDNTAVTGYYIVRNGSTIGTSTGTSYADTTVYASTTYNYQVMAYDAANNLSGLSSPASVSTPSAPDTSPPTQPVNLSATAVSSTQINLSWSASSDNVGVTSYEVYRDGIKIATVTTTSFGNTGLNAGTTYEYHVIAKDAAGNYSAQSNTVSATTQSPVVTNGSLNGTITSSKGGVVSGATIAVTVNGKKYSYKSASNGTYFISNLPPATYQVKYSANRFTATTISIGIFSGQTTTRNVTLQAR